MRNMERRLLIRKLVELQVAGEVSSFSIDKGGAAPGISVSWVGSLEDRPALKDFLDKNEGISRDRLEQDFYFLGSSLPATSGPIRDEVRPGSGLIRVFGGKSEGPGGTLTCLLSSKDGQASYFAAAGHVLTDFWRDLTSQGSIYRYRQGFPATGSTRFLGKVVFRTPRPSRAYLPASLDKARLPVAIGRKAATLDVGIVELDTDAELKQRTTCFGSLGEGSLGPLKAEETRVFKCGSQEAHWTEAVFRRRKLRTSVYGPDGKFFIFRNQLEFRDLESGEGDEPGGPRNSQGTPFAVPGDSGSIVVEKRTRIPVGMLVAGSVLDGRYLVTPFDEIVKFFDKNRLVVRRA